jgi:hypothetical protein
LIETGNLPKPQGKWWVEWPEASAMSEDAESIIMERKTNALVNYSNSPDAQLIVPPQEFRTDFLGMDPESEYEIEEPEYIEEIEPDDIDDIDDVVPVEIPETNAAPKPLYIRRDVLNKKAITDWAKANGLTNIKVDLHVTIIYSKRAVDWMQFQQPWSEDEDGTMMIHPGGARLVEKFGEAIVLSFTCDGLQWRHRDLVQSGCSHGHPTYQPHITITYDSEGIDPDSITPYRGAIALGPEIFEEIEPERKFNEVH